MFSSILKKAETPANDQDGPSINDLAAKIQRAQALEDQLERAKAERVNTVAALDAKIERYAESWQQARIQALEIFGELIGDYPFLEKTQDHEEITAEQKREYEEREWDE